MSKNEQINNAYVKDVVNYLRRKGLEPEVLASDKRVSELTAHGTTREVGDVVLGMGLLNPAIRTFRQDAFPLRAQDGLEYHIDFRDNALSQAAHEALGHEYKTGSPGAEYEVGISVGDHRINLLLYLKVDSGQLSCSLTSDLRKSLRSLRRSIP
jgi:hypothetical protein